MREAMVSIGLGLLISGAVLWLSLNYSHNAAIGVPVTLLSLPFLPGGALYAAISKRPEINVTLLSLMLASGAVFYGFVVFIAWSVMKAVGRRG